MRPLPTLVILGAVFVGCRSTPELQPEPGFHTGACPSIPASVNSFKLTEQDRFDDPALGSSYRFTDGSADRVTVFLYPVPSDVEDGTDDQARVDAEGAKFLAAFPIGVQRGWYDAYEIAFADPQPIHLQDQTIAGFSAAVPTRKDDAITVEVQYLYLVSGCFLKARGSLDGSTWMQSSFPKFAKDLGAAAATQNAH